MPNSMQWRPPQRIRPISIGLIFRNADLLVVAVKSDTGTVKGWRPPGGAIEFGEAAEDAVKREFLEELGQPIRCRRQLCVLENVYLHEGVRGHEVVFAFEAEFMDSSAYSRDRYVFLDGDVENEAEWKRGQDFSDAGERLFPYRLVQYVAALLQEASDDNSAA